MLTMEDDALSAQVRDTVGKLLSGAEQLKGLAQTLDGFGGLSGHADADEVSLAAIGVKATAVHALITAGTTLGLSERLATLAAILKLVHAGDD